MFLFGPAHRMAEALRRRGGDPRLIEEAEREAQVA